MSAALTVRGLEVRRGAQAVLRGVDLDVAPGEICALMGTSGAGKTTIARMLLDAVWIVHPPDSRWQNKPACLFFHIPSNAG
jgi:ABC-type transporter Mla maintaining outer membrane lipid asymmetry ATPase subunit MlaF